MDQQEHTLLIICYYVINRPFQSWGLLACWPCQAVTESSVFVQKNKTKQKQSVEKKINFKKFNKKKYAEDAKHKPGSTFQDPMLTLEE